MSTSNKSCKKRKSNVSQRSTHETHQKKMTDEKKPRGNWNQNKKRQVFEDRKECKYFFCGLQGREERERESSAGCQERKKKKWQVLEDFIFFYWFFTLFCVLFGLDHRKRGFAPSTLIKFQLIIKHPQHSKLFLFRTRLPSVAWYSV